MIIMIRNMAEFDWQLGRLWDEIIFIEHKFGLNNNEFFFKEQLFEFIPVFMTVFFSEFFIDLIKHAFVMKFNKISAKVFYKSCKFNYFGHIF